MPGHVYLIGSQKFRWYKIGKSSDARIRVLDLGVLLPFRVEVITVCRCDSYSYVERILHEKYAEFRVNGEWFHFHSDTVEEVVTDMHLLGIPVVGITGFHNLPNDTLPDGKEHRVKFKTVLPEEERERRRQEAIGKRLPSVTCSECGRNYRPKKTCIENS